MKATKLLCGIAAMALAFAACNKVEQPANESGNFKSIAIKFDNVLTKAVDTPVEETAIKVNNLQVFFSDGSNLYPAMNADETPATQYFAVNDEMGAIEQANHTYHFLPSEVNEVLVVANLGEEKTFANKTALKDYVVNVATQQAQANVALYGSSSENGGSFTQLAAPSHNDHPNKQVDYYSATVKLFAKVARVEVTGFTYAGSSYSYVGENGDIVNVADHRSYASMVVDKIAVANYGTEITFGGSSASASSTTVDLSNTAKINDYLGTLTTSDWMFNTPEAELNDDNSFAWTVPSVGEGVAAIAQTYAYTVAPTAVPNICVALRGKVAADAQDTPLFLATKALKNKENGTDLKALQAGKVYRLNFTFDDTDLNLQGKCIDVTVEVADWEVVEVTPEF